MIEREWKDAVLAVERREREAGAVIDRHNARITSLEERLKHLIDLVDELTVVIVGHDKTIVELDKLMSSGNTP